MDSLMCNCTSKLALRAPSDAQLRSENDGGYCHLSSHTSSNRRLLYWLLSCGLKFFTCDCQQLPAVPCRMTGRAASSTRIRSISHTSLRRFSLSSSRDCAASSLSTSALQYWV